MRKKLERVLPVLVVISVSVPSVARAYYREDAYLGTDAGSYGFDSTPIDSAPSYAPVYVEPIYQQPSYSDPTPIAPVYAPISQEPYDPVSSVPALPVAAEPPQAPVPLLQPPVIENSPPPIQLVEQPPVDEPYIIPYIPYIPPIPLPAPAPAIPALAFPQAAVPTLAFPQAAGPPAPIGLASSSAGNSDSPSTPAVENCIDGWDQVAVLEGSILCHKRGAGLGSENYYTIRPPIAVTPAPNWPTQVPGFPSIPPVSSPPAEGTAMTGGGGAGPGFDPALLMNLVRDHIAEIKDRCPRVGSYLSAVPIITISEPGAMYFMETMADPSGTGFFIAINVAYYGIGFNNSGGGPLIDLIQQGVNFIGSSSVSTALIHEALHRMLGGSGLMYHQAPLGTDSVYRYSTASDCGESEWGNAWDNRASGGG